MMESHVEIVNFSTCFGKCTSMVFFGREAAFP